MRDQRWLARGAGPVTGSARLRETMPNTIHAFCDDILADHDAVQLARMVREREVSAPELIRAAIARAERVQPSLAAIAHE